MVYVVVLHAPLDDVIAAGFTKAGAALALSRNLAADHDYALRTIQRYVRTNEVIAVSVQSLDGMTIREIERIDLDFEEDAA